MIEIVVEPENMVLVTRVMLVDVFEKLNFIKTLIKEVFIVLNDLHAYIHSCMQVMCLNCFAEGSRTQVFSHMIASCNNCIYHNRKILVFLETSPADCPTGNISTKIPTRVSCTRQERLDLIDLQKKCKLKGTVMPDI